MTDTAPGAEISLRRKARIAAKLYERMADGLIPIDERTKSEKQLYCKAAQIIYELSAYAPDDVKLKVIK